MSRIVLIGCNHRSAPVELRERLAFEEAKLPQTLERLVQRDEVDEAMILSTCNRVEVLARGPERSAATLHGIEEFLRSEREVTAEEIERHSYRLVGRDAVQHLFQVAAGLRSMILGEPQILGQVKLAHRIANRAGATGTVVERLLQQCLRTAKGVRTRTGITRHPVSVAYAAVHLARQIFGKLEGRRALLLGAGKMAELVARHLIGAGIDEVVVASRTFNRASLAARRFGGRPVHWKEGVDRLSEVDVVVSCTASARVVITKEDVARASRVRRSVPLFLIDIAVPRDIDPRVNELDNVYLYDIDGLQDVVDANLEERRSAADLALKEIDVDVDSFLDWCQSLEITPTIVSLNNKLSEVGRGEIERFRRRLGTLSPKQRDAVDELTNAVIRKVLHRPIVHLRGSVARGDIEASTALYRRIFGLDVPESDGRRAAKSDAPKDTGEPSTPADSDRPGPTRVLRGGKEG